MILLWSIQLFFLLFCFAAPPVDSEFASAMVGDDTIFGNKLLKKEFLLNYTNFNHGSFGSCPKSVLNYQAQLRQQQEQQPDPWMRSRYRELVNQTREDIAKYVAASNSDNVVLVESASTAVNSVLRSVAWKEGDILMYFSVAYGMVRFTAAWLQEMYGIELLEVPVEFPMMDSKSGFVHPTEDALKKLQRDNKLVNLRLAVLDHIVSVPAVREPIEELSKTIKSFQPDCFVLVDGAHAMGQVRSINLTEWEPTVDAYLSNGHKWFYSPKGSAFLWVNPKVITSTFPEPTVVSSDNPPGTSFTERYTYVSTRDYTAWISMSEALKFRQNVLGGDEAIYNYVHGLAMEAKAMLMRTWNVPALAPDYMEDFMFNIGLPISSVKVGTALHKKLLNEHQIYMLVIHDAKSNLFYTRLSAQVYLELKDFAALAELVLKYTLEFEQDHIGALPERA